MRTWSEITYAAYRILYFIEVLKNFQKIYWFRKMTFFQKFYWFRKMTIARPVIESASIMLYNEFYF